MKPNLSIEINSGFKNRKIRAFFSALTILFSLFPQIYRLSLSGGKIGAIFFKARKEDELEKLAEAASDAMDKVIKTFRNQK